MSWSDRMSAWLPNSIFDRLRLLLAAVFAVGAAAALVAAWLFSTSAATESYDRLLISAAAQISEAITVEQGRFTVLPPDSAFETLAQSQGDRFFFAVRAPDGTLLTGEAALRPRAMSARDDAPAFGYTEFAGTTMRTISMSRLIATPSAKGWCTVVVAQSLEARHHMVARLMLEIGATILAVGVLGFVASLGAVRRALRPFGRIGRALAGRSAQDLDPLDVESPRETQALVAAINSAFSRLNVRLNYLQDFTSVAAHQIRTPLAALGAQSELLLSDRTASQREARVDRLKINIAKLSRLTNQLLGQAMVSYRAERVPQRRIELVELVRDALRDAIPESLDRDIAVEFEAQPAVIYIDGDATTLREALTNLLDNAVTHGATSLLRVHITTGDKSAIVIVADDGPGIPASLWDAVIRPFQIPRPDGNGAGLGLSIAANVVKAHGGELSFATSTDGLFEIVVTLATASSGGEGR